MFRKRFFILTLISILTLSLMLFAAGCGAKKDDQASSTGDDGENGKKRIALVVKTLNNPFFISMEEGAKKAAGKAGVELIVQAPEREIDVEKQMQIVENLITQRVDAILIAPSGSKEIVPAIKKANDAGIPVIAVDTKVDEKAMKEQGAHVEAFIGSDNEEGGRIAGEYVVKALNGKGKVAILEGIPGHETGDARLRGFREAVDKTDIEVVASLTANWERAEGYNVMQNILQAHPDIDAVFACNDMMALGALEAIEAAGKGGEILIIGFDATDEAKTAIKEGRMTGSVAQYPSEMGRLGVEKAVELLNGGKIEKYIPTKVELITKEKLN